RRRRVLLRRRAWRAVALAKAGCLAKIYAELACEVFRMRVKLGVTSGRTKEIGHALVLALIRARFWVDLHPADWIANCFQWNYLRFGRQFNHGLPGYLGYGTGKGNCPLQSVSSVLATTACRVVGRRGDRRWKPVLA